MSSNRRTFLKTTLAGVALAAAGQHEAWASPVASLKKTSGKTNLKISFQEGTAPGKSLNEKFDFMEKHQVVGFEPHGNGLAGRIDEVQQALKGRNIKVSAICAGFSGFILSSQEEVRQECMDTMKALIEVAGRLGSVGVIIVPAFNRQLPVLPHTMETRNFLCEKFGELGEFAVQHNTSVILEPLNRKEAFYLRLLSDAASICRDINSKGVTCLGDFWHMTTEETSDMGAFLSAGQYLSHVHIASRKRRSMPGEDGDADNYIDGFKALKMIDYQGYVSFECGCQGEREVVVPAALKLLREQWNKA